MDSQEVLIVRLGPASKTTQGTEPHFVIDMPLVPPPNNTRP